MSTPYPHSNLRNPQHLFNPQHPQTHQTNNHLICLTPSTTQSASNPPTHLQNSPQSTSNLQPPLLPSCQENFTPIERETTTTIDSQNNKCKWQNAATGAEKRHRQLETDDWTIPWNDDCHFYLDAKLSLLCKRLDKAFNSDEMNAALETLHIKMENDHKNKKSL